MEDELLMARDPDGGSGRCLPVPDEPALQLDYISVVVKDLDRAIRLFGALGYVVKQRALLQGNQNVVMAKKNNEGEQIIVQSPVSRQSELGAFLTARGSGVMHIAFETASLEQTRKVLEGFLAWEPMEEPVLAFAPRVLTSKPDPATGLVFEIPERNPDANVRLFREAGKRSL